MVRKFAEACAVFAVSIEPDDAGARGVGDIDFALAVNFDLSVGADLCLIDFVVKAFTADDALDRDGDGFGFWDECGDVDGELAIGGSSRNVAEHEWAWKGGRKGSLLSDVLALAVFRFKGFDSAEDVEADAFDGSGAGVFDFGLTFQVAFGESEIGQGEVERFVGSVGFEVELGAGDCSVRRDFDLKGEALGDGGDFHTRSNESIHRAEKVEPRHVLGTEGKGQKDAVHHLITLLMQRKCVSGIRLPFGCQILSV